MQQMVDLLPDKGSLWPATLPETIDSKGKLTVGFLTGCVGCVLGTDINRKTADLLVGSGANVYAQNIKDAAGRFINTMANWPPRRIWRGEISICFCP